MCGQHLSSVGRDATAGRRVGRLRAGTRPLAAAAPAGHAPPQAQVHAAAQAHEVSTLAVMSHYTPAKCGETLLPDDGWGGCVP